MAGWGNEGGEGACDRRRVGKKTNEQVSLCFSQKNVRLGTN